MFSAGEKCSFNRAVVDRGLAGEVEVPRSGPEMISMLWYSCPRCRACRWPPRRWERWKPGECHRRFRYIRHFRPADHPRGDKLELVVWRSDQRTIVPPLPVLVASALIVEPEQGRHRSARKDRRRREFRRHQNIAAAGGAGCVDDGGNEEH